VIETSDERDYSGFNEEMKENFLDPSNDTKILLGLSTIEEQYTQQREGIRQQV
jgi:hypothetical protein